MSNERRILAREEVGLATATFWPLPIRLIMIGVENDLDGTVGHGLVRNARSRGWFLIHPTADGGLVALEQSGQIRLGVAEVAYVQ
jgi:hypothetical protein